MREAIVLGVIVGIVAAIVAFFDFKDTPEEAAAKREKKELERELDVKKVRRELRRGGKVQMIVEIPENLASDELMLALDEIEHETFFETIKECRDDFPDVG